MTPAQVQTVRDEWLSAPRGQRVAVLDRWAASLGVRRATLYRALQKLGHRGPERPRAETLADPANETPAAIRYRQLRAWAGVLADLIARVPDGSLPLDLVLKSALTPQPGTGAPLLPAEAGAVALGTYQRILREEMCMRDRTRRQRRMHADFANQAWQFDASTSKRLIVESETDDGDYILLLSRRPIAASGYKNKPLGADRLRLLYYGAWDMHTGGRISLPVVARGESGLDAIEALVTMMQGATDDPRIPMRGMPTDLWSDNGSLLKNAASRELLDRLLDGYDKHVRRGEAYAKERMGGIEQTWRRLWQRFEDSLYLVAPARGRYTMTLSDLRGRLVEYLAETWARPSRRDPAVSRRDAYIRSLQSVGGVRLCPEAPLETIASEVRRWVDGAGVIRWNKIEYEVPELQHTWVIARRALDGSGRIVVEHEETGRRWDVTPYQIPRYGEDIRRRVLPIDSRRKAVADHPAGADPYAPSDSVATTVAAPATAPVPVPAANVIAGRFAQRERPAEPLADPLAADAYSSLSQAMAALYTQLRTPLSAEMHQIAEQRLLRDGLRISAVRQLAAALSAAQRAAM